MNREGFFLFAQNNLPNPSSSHPGSDAPIDFGRDTPTTTTTTIGDDESLEINTISRLEEILERILDSAFDAEFDHSHHWLLINDAAHWEA